MKCEKRSQQTPVKPSLGIISLASPTKPASNIRTLQVTLPASTCKQRQLARATGFHKYGSHVIPWAQHTLIFKYNTPWDTEAISEHGDELTVQHSRVITQLMTLHPRSRDGFPLRPWRDAAAGDGQQHTDLCPPVLWQAGKWTTTPCSWDL